MRKKITVVDANQYEDGFPPSILDGFLAWVQETTAEIPKEYWGDTHVEFGSYESYGSAYGSVEVYYYREETDQEAQDRMDRLEAKQRSEMARELETLERLKRKYERN